MKKKKIASKRRNKKRLQPQPSAQALLQPVEVLVSDLPPEPVERELTAIEREAMHCAANMELYGSPYPTTAEKAKALLKKRIIEV